LNCWHNVSGSIYWERRGIISFAKSC
jgi:hypothetical protein